MIPNYSLPRLVPDSTEEIEPGWPGYIIYLIIPAIVVTCAALALILYICHSLAYRR